MLFLTVFGQSCSSTLRLAPPNNRPVYSIEVGDATEIELLQQQLGLEVVYAKLPVVYFYGDKQGLMTRLEAIGYAKPQAQRLETVYVRYGKLVGKYNEQEIGRLGVKLLNREKNHLVVYGNLSNLRAARDKGYVLEKLDYEPRPREIEVRVKNEDEIQKIAGLQVDIFSVNQPERGGPYIVQGTAYDAQIDELKSLNFTVTQK